MERFYLFFLVLSLWGTASGIGVWDGQPAQHWRSDWLKSPEGPPSVFPAQQTTSSSLPSAVQSLKVGAMLAESISNSNARLISWKPSVQGGSSISNVNPGAQGAASGPVSAQSLHSGAGLQSQYTAGDQEIHTQYPPPSKAQGFLTAQSSTPRNCAFRRRPSPINSVPVQSKGSNYGPGYQAVQFSKPVRQCQKGSLNQQDRFGVNDSSERLSSQTSPQSLQTKYVPTLQAHTSRLLPPYQSLASASKPPQQGSYGVQSWKQTIPSTSDSTLQTQTSSLGTPFQSLESTWLDSQSQTMPSFPPPVTQTSRLVAPSQSLASASDSSGQGSYGVPSSWYVSQGQSISSDTQPTLQTLAPRPVVSSQILASASNPQQQGSYGVQSSWYDSLEQSNPSASQLSQYAPVFQTQTSRFMPPASSSLANQYSSTSQSSLDQTVPVYPVQLTPPFQSAVSHSSLYTPLQGQDVQASWFDTLNQVPSVKTQSLYKPVFQSQELENQYNFPSQTWVSADPSGRAQWYKVSYTGFEALKTIEPLPPFHSLANIYNQAASSDDPPVSQSPNSPISIDFASQNQWIQSLPNLSPLPPTVLQVPQSPWP